MRFARGQAAIALSLALPIAIGAGCIVASIWTLHLSSTRLQQAVDAAVRSGAVYLPTRPGMAESAARTAAEMSGIRADEILYSRPSPDGRSITMVVEHRVRSPLLRLSGSVVVIKAAATAAARRAAKPLFPNNIRVRFLDPQDLINKDVLTCINV